MTHRLPIHLSIEQVSNVYGRSLDEFDPADKGLGGIRALIELVALVLFVGGLLAVAEAIR